MQHGWYKIACNPKLLLGKQFSCSIISVVLADCTQVLSESSHHRLSNWNPLQSLPLHFTDENSREVMWFIQAQKAYMDGSCMYSKIQKIQQWVKVDQMS